MARVRLDSLLADRGLFDSRTRAAAAVLAGEVLVGDGRRRAEKPGQMVPHDAVVDVVDRMPYVSRGGIKLANALDRLGVEVTGRRCLDVGASTGGFTDCLLQRGARAVIAVDVAYGELHWSLRSDERVVVMERCNARALSAEALPWRPSFAACDVSFISLTKVLPAVVGCMATDDAWDLLAMVKPQFEVGRGRVGKGGVVRSTELRREALVTVAQAVMAVPGVAVRGFASSGLPGPKGNVETFLWLASDSPGLDAAAIEAAAAEVEPG